MVAFEQHRGRARESARKRERGREERERERKGEGGSRLGAVGRGLSTLRAVGRGLGRRPGAQHCCDSPNLSPNPKALVVQQHSTVATSIPLPQHHALDTYMCRVYTHTLMYVSTYMCLSVEGGLRTKYAVHAVLAAHCTHPAHHLAVHALHHHTCVHVCVSMCACPPTCSHAGALVFVYVHESS